MYKSHSLRDRSLIMGGGGGEFIYWSSVEYRGLNVEGEGKKSRARVKSRRVKSRG